MSTRINFFQGPRSALVLSLAMAFDGAALAQEANGGQDTNAAPASKMNAKAPVVVVSATPAERDPRLNDTASKSVMSHEEITKYGDSNALDVLKRAPGVVVVRGFPTMRGLGAGYVQLLVNGDRPPPGLRLENLDPAQIERIEIMRSASAEFSTAAMAGTINVVLRQVVTTARRDLVLRAAPGHEARSGASNLQIADRSGNLSYVITADFSVLRSANDYLSESFVPDNPASGLPGYERASEYLSTTLGKTGTLSSRWNWKIDSNNQLNVQEYLQRFDQRRSSNYESLRVRGAAPLFLNGNSAEDQITTSGQVELNWITLVAGGRLNVRASVTGSRRTSDADDLSTGIAKTRTLRVNENDRTSRISSTGKYTRSVFNGHALALGWDISQEQGKSKRRDFDANDFQGPTFNIDEHYRTDIDRTAFYIQDEWNVTKKWSMYLGMRNETIRTASDLSGTASYHTYSRNSVFTPIAQTLYKLDQPGRQLRLALTRTFKPPQTAQLAARRLFTIENDRQRPDRSGNPGLVPELASGLDLTYENFWRPDALFSVSAGGRRISNYITEVVSADTTGRWLAKPENEGNARTYNLESELKFPLRAFWKNAPKIEFRTYVNRNWSSVDAVGAPGNRVARQVPFSSSLNLDYLGDRWTSGALFVFNKGQLVHTHVDQWTGVQYGRDLELHFGYKISPKAKLKIDLRNLLGEDILNERLYLSPGGVGYQRGTQFRGPRATLSLELKL